MATVPSASSKFLTVKKNLSKAFHWSLDARRSFKIYLESHGWDVPLCPTEADVKIAADCQPSDVVISGLLAHENVSINWRPLSKGNFLVYVLEDVLKALSLSRVQLTMLSVVSKNDYGRNIHGLGCSTNFSIISGSWDTKPSNPCGYEPGPGSSLGENIF
ncbi:unnamed protein product [Mortierella alpina]